MFCMFFLLFAVFNCFQFLRAEQTAYESIEELACWQCVTDTESGYRVLRKQSGCVNVFAIFAKNGECTDMFAYKVTPGGTGMYSTRSNVFPRDALAVSRTIWETRRSDAERSYPLMSYALQDEVTRKWCGVLDFDNEELAVGIDGSCVVRKHCGYPVSPRDAFDVLNKNDAEVFQPIKGEEREKIRLLGSSSGFENREKPENEKTVSGQQASNEKGRKGVKIVERAEQDLKVASVSASLRTGSKRKPLSKGVKSRNLKVDDVRCKDGRDLTFPCEGMSNSNLNDHVSTGAHRSASVSSVVYSMSNKGSHGEVAVPSHLQPSCSTLSEVQKSKVPGVSTYSDFVSNSTVQHVPFQLTGEEATGNIRELSLPTDNGVQNKWGGEGKKSEKLPFAFSHGGKRWAVVYARKAFVRKDGTSINRQLDNHGLAVFLHERNIQFPMSIYCMYKDETSMIFQHRFCTYVSLPNGMNAPTKVECSFVPNFEIVK